MNYCSLNPCDIANGLGVRVSLFVTGCDKHCKGCFNPETWNPSFGKPFTKDTLTELLVMLDKPFIKGLSLLGGDPFFPENRKEISIICRTVKDKFDTKDIWMYTGYLYEDIIKYDLEQTNLFDCYIDRKRACTATSYEILKYVDVLVDGPFIEELKDVSLKFVGSSNQRVIDISKSIDSNKIVLYDFKK